MGTWLPNFKFSNGTLGIGPFRQKLETDDTARMTEHQWEISDVSVYVYMTGDIPEGEMLGAVQYCEIEVAKWKPRI